MRCCFFFGIGCSGAPCNGRCNVCKVVGYIGTMCEPAHNQAGSCRCVTYTDAAFTVCQRYGQSCYGVQVWPSHNCPWP